MKRLLIKLGFFIVLALIGYSLYNNKLIIFNIRTYIEDYRQFALIIILMLAIIRPFLLLPITALCIITGLTLDFRISILVTVFSMWVSSTVVYYLSRLFSDDINQYISNPKYINILAKIKMREFRIILIIRLSMLVHFDVLSVLAGIAGVSYKKYILASFLGFIPEIILYSSLSFGIYNLDNFKYIIPILLVFIGLTYIFRKRVSI